jgi:glycosyltransferase involved in cell wall biosynthesis
MKPIETPQVSIIMNVRNGAATLEAALESVMQQTFSDWELIVWDDGSTDATREIVARYRDNRVRYTYCDEHSTLGRARDRALRVARGEWLAFLDQDDLWLPRKLERQMLLAGPEVGLIYGRTLMFFKDGSKRDFDRWHEFEALPEGDIFRKLIERSCFINMSSAALRRMVVSESGGIPQGIEIIPDYHLFLQVARHHPARAVQEPVCLYRVHPDSLTRSQYRGMQQEALMLIDRWKGDLPPWLARRRRRIHHTVLAFEEMCSLSSAASGVSRLLREGSITFLASRPFARAYRATRRRVAEPYWVKAMQLSGAAGTIGADLTK